MNEEINKIIDSLEGCIGMFDYMITPIESNLLVSYIRELQQENKKIKKQLVQQKEFIKYLEDESKEIYRDGGLRQNIYKEILQKYKSIIGGK